jgi:hypothetical protein
MTKIILTLIAVLIVVAAGLTIYHFTRAAGDIKLTVNHKISVVIPSGGCGIFDLTTQTTTDNARGYNLAVYTDNLAGFTVAKNSDGAAISTDKTAMTDIKSTGSSNSSGDNIMTTYKACADATVAPGDYDLVVTYRLTTIQPEVANGANFQDVTGDPTKQCSHLNVFTGRNTNDIVHMIDSRNGYYYWVGKLADGKCWMLQNLQLDGASMLSTTDPDGNARTAITTLDSSNTNLPSGDTLAASATASDGTTSITLLPTAAASSSTWISSYTNMDVVSPDSNDAATYHASTSTLGNDNTKDYGYLYNWCAAMGGQARTCSDNDPTQPQYYDICPKGWHIPTGDYGGEYSILGGVMPGGSTVYQSDLTDSSHPWLASHIARFEVCSLASTTIN